MSLRSLSSKIFLQRNFNQIKYCLFSGHGGVGGLQETGGDIDVRSKVESMLVMSGGEGYIDFRIGGY